MNRRTFIMTGTWLSTVAGSAWLPLASAARQNGTLAIVDSTLACGPPFARYAAHLKLQVFETGDDIGALWYTALAPLCDRTGTHIPRSLIGLIRASDYFVLDELVARSGLAYRLEHSREEPGDGSTRPLPVAFSFAPSLDRWNGSKSLG